MSVERKSRRADGLGHWPAGKHRSPLSAAERAQVIRRLRKLVDAQESMRGAARVLGVSDRLVRRVLSGEQQPGEKLSHALDGARAAPAPALPARAAAGK